MVRMLFEYVEYDLDTQRITGFRLKPWAEDFLILREALYETEEGTEFQDGVEAFGSEDGSEFDATCLLPEGFNTPSRTLRDTAMQVILQSFYGLAPIATKPLNYHTPLQPERNQEIRRRFAAGESGSSLAREYGLSKSRVFRIIHGERR